MYEAYYGLTEKPFSILPDPDFIYWGDAHSMAFAMMEYGVMNNAGFTVITGDIGSGKTTLIRQLLRKLEDDVTVVVVSNTRDDSKELIKWILLAFDQPFSDGSYVALYQQYRDFLLDHYAQGRRTVLIIDEAQNLGVETIEELRMLSNINVDKDQILQLILVGQPQLKDLVQRPELKQFAQRVASDFHLQPFTSEEGVRYINHRLYVAGSRVPLFSQQACQLIVEASRGIPRVINILCDTALTYAFSWDAPEVTSEIVKYVIQDKMKFGVISIADPGTVHPNMSSLDEHRKSHAKKP